jgi:long-chain acyl-CoA synthetase
MRADPFGPTNSIRNLSTLLLDHPFTSDDFLIHTINQSVTAGQARTRAIELANELRESGIRAGHAVAVRLPNGPDVIHSMMAIWLIEAVFVPINPLLPESQVAEVLEPTAPAAIIESTGVRLIAAPRTYDPGTAFILWTSGTTGRPKPILHSHRGYGELIDRVLAPLRSGGGARTRPPSPNLIPVSLALNAGIYNALFGLRAGAPLVIMDRFTTSVFAELVQRFEIRSTVLPPAALTMLNDDPEITELTPLKYVRSITAPLSPLQARRFTDKFGAFVLNSYGQAEIGEVIGWTAEHAKNHPDKVGAAGLPHTGVSLKIVDEHRHVVADGVVGELLVRPPNMAIGYASGADLADRIDADGFIGTGDLARADADGFIWIEGRLGDVINRGGNKVFPDEVEEVLRLSPSVTDAAVISVPDARLGEVPVAFVVTESELDRPSLDALCRTHLTPYKIPVDYVRIASLPRNEIGKLLRRQLAAKYGTRHP